MHYTQYQATSITTVLAPRLSISFKTLYPFLTDSDVINMSRPPSPSTTEVPAALVPLLSFLSSISPTSSTASPVPPSLSATSNLPTKTIPIDHFSRSSSSHSQLELSSKVGPAAKGKGRIGSSSRRRRSMSWLTISHLNHWWISRAMWMRWCFRPSR